MKRALSVLFAILFIFPLWACTENYTAESGKITNAPIAASDTSTAPANTESTETVHVHSWKEATCTAPKTCSSCGAAEGQAQEHNWKDATYTAPKSCSVCGITEGDPVALPGKENYHGHVYTGGSASKKYHYEENCPGKNSHEITWEEVTRRNLGPCGTCVLK